MKNAINNQFKMNPGSKEVDSVGTFKNDAAVLNMGTPSNYGTPDSAPLNSNHDDPDKKETRKDKGTRVYEAALAKIQKQKENREKKKNEKKSSFPKIKMGMGSSYTTLKD